MKGGAGPAREIFFNSFLIFSLRGPEKDSFNRTNHLEFQRQVESLCCNYLWKTRLSPLQSTSSFITFPYWGLTQQEHILFNISCFPFLSFRKEQFYSIRLNLTPLLKYFCVVCLQMFYLLCWMFFSPPLNLLSSDLSFPAAPSPPWQALKPGGEKFKLSAHKEIAHKRK